MKKQLHIFSILISVVSLLSAAPSTQIFEQGDKQLIVYSDVPELKPSEFYKMRVRSEATQGEWIDVFCHISRSLYSSATMPNPHQASRDPKADRSMENYLKMYKDWSHTYANIEMNGVIEVELSRVNGEAIKMAAILPVTSASVATLKDGKAYFTIKKPTQVTIDIDDEINTIAKKDASVIPYHAVSFFANPIFDKPKLGDPGVVEVKAGSKVPEDPATYETLYFSAGIHDLGRSIKVYPNKKFYISGDAIVYGTFNNKGIPAGENCKIYGVGTISGGRLKHPFYHPEGKYHIDPKDKVSEFTPWKTFSISATKSIVVEGVCVADPAFHTMQIMGVRGKGKAPEFQTSVRWVKIIAWRANGDGVGGPHVVEDCFLRTVDDSAYIGGDMRRVIFWKDHGAVFHMANIRANPKVIEDCEVICLGTKSTAVVFNQRGSGAGGILKVDLHVRNFRLTDTNPKGSMFALSSGTKGGGSYNGIVFENITIAAECTKDGKNRILGTKVAPWDGGITFKNLVIGDKKIMNLDSFKTNEYVKNIKFEN
jgi:hypothetical protein